MYNSIIFISSSAVLFLIVSFMVKYKFKLFVIIVNMLFLCLTYYSVSQILGNPLPLDYSIPFYINSSVFDKGVTVKYFAPSFDGKSIYMLLSQNGTKFYKMKFDKTLINAMRKAQQEAAQGGDLEIILKRNLTPQKRSDNNENNNDGSTTFSLEIIKHGSKMVPKHPQGSYSDGAENFDVK